MVESSLSVYGHGKRIGGPGTRLPFVIESLVAWLLAVACLAVPANHYVISTHVVPALERLFRPRRLKAKNANKRHPNTFPCWLPLTTCSRSEMDRKTPMERYEQLRQLLENITQKQVWTDDGLVRVIRRSQSCRRLATLAMRPTHVAAAATPENTQETHPTETVLGQQLIRIWPELLILPPPLPLSLVSSVFEISLIVPSYHEEGTTVKAKLIRALETCQNPARIEVLVIDAGGCPSLRQEVETIKDGWGRLRVIAFAQGGGRGPCLNFGASQASGRVYTFCHSDTTLPIRWDFDIRTALDKQRHDGGHVVRANSCAFSFGIDTSPAGLNGGPFPPGIKAVEATANIRTHLYSLPYGDQVLSVPSDVFDYIGGFPDQCLMEDYELVSLLRKRAALLSKFGITEEERLTIINGPPALCSPRRWQKFGVPYVTYMNSRFVNLYTCSGMTPDDLFELYYKRPPPERSSQLSPWETQLYS